MTPALGCGGHASQSERKQKYIWKIAITMNDHFPLGTWDNFPELEVQLRRVNSQYYATYTL